MYIYLRALWRIYVWRHDSPRGSKQSTMFVGRPASYPRANNQLQQTGPANYQRTEREGVEAHQLCTICWYKYPWRFDRDTVSEIIFGHKWKPNETANPTSIESRKRGVEFEYLQVFSKMEATIFFLSFFWFYQPRVRNQHTKRKPANFDTIKHG